MAKTPDLYSTKDSNQNRKLEQLKSSYFSIFSWTVAIVAGVFFIYYYYTEMERPPLYHVPVAPPVVEVPQHSHYSKNDVSHPYNEYKTPYEQ
jgi:hypothetical protein